MEAADTFELRQAVLRPHQSIKDMALPGDDRSDSGHFIARARGRVVATGTVRREEPAWDSCGRGSWRLRGMATAEGWRGQGLGSRLLDAVVDHVAAHGGGLLWCNARVGAVEFYERAGLMTRGDAWDEPLIGPHVVMTREVDPSRP